MSNVIEKVQENENKNYLNFEN